MLLRLSTETITSTGRKEALKGCAGVCHKALLVPEHVSCVRESAGGGKELRGSESGSEEELRHAA